ncbi:hypothetical protein BaRGS_00027428, partial [Batillaria attramentaria]
RDIALLPDNLQLRKSLLPADFVVISLVRRYQDSASTHSVTPSCGPYLCSLPSCSEPSFIVAYAIK